jgi:hypothetical protein
MSRESKKTGWIIFAALVLLLLAALNPSTEDFQAWYAGQAQSQVTQGDKTGLVGVLKSGLGAVAGALSGAVASNYKRSNYYLFSTYSLGDRSFLGVAHLFIKLK